MYRVFGGIGLRKHLKNVFQIICLDFMGDGSAWGGRLPCKQDIQIGSIPISSTNPIEKR